MMTTVAAMGCACQSGTCHCELTNPAMLPVSRSYPRIFGNCEMIIKTGTPVR